MHARIAFLALALLMTGGCAKNSGEPVVVGGGTAKPSAESTGTAALGDIVLGFELVSDGFEQPLLATAPTGDDRLFVVEKTGRVWIIKDGVRLDTPFLDLSRSVSTNSERGLLGLAFSPAFERDGRFFVDYTDRDGNTVVSRFLAEGDRASANSETVLLTVEQPYANHNGGMLAFGPDERLYVALGDGGSGGDPHGNGQNLGTLLGKLLRLDVSGVTGHGTEGNPFANRSGARPEIWSYGLRNPWRFSFDRETGDLWIADVGQDTWEEIDFQPASSTGGENYGWNLYEGTHPFPPGSAAIPGAFTMPVVEYSHDTGNSITGGYVYRGLKQPALKGVYIYGDYVSGRVWGLTRDSSQVVANALLAETSYGIASFGEDGDGELYLVDLNGGAVLRVTATTRSH